MGIPDRQLPLSGRAVGGLVLRFRPGRLPVQNRRTFSLHPDRAPGSVSCALAGDDRLLPADLRPRPLVSLLQVVSAPATGQPDVDWIVAAGAVQTGGTGELLRLAHRKSAERTVRETARRTRIPGKTELRHRSLASPDRDRWVAHQRGSRNLHRGVAGSAAVAALLQHKSGGATVSVLGPVHRMRSSDSGTGGPPADSPGTEAALRARHLLHGFGIFHCVALPDPRTTVGPGSARFPAAHSGRAVHHLVLGDVPGTGLADATRDRTQGTGSGGRLES